jgi:hypothetical protein
VLSARFWSQRASQRGPPQRDISSWRAFTADQQSGLCEKDQQSGLCEKELTLLRPCPCRAPIPIAARGCADSPIRDGLKKIRIKNGCAHAAKWRRKGVR